VEQQMKFAEALPPEVIDQLHKAEVLFEFIILLQLLATKTFPLRNIVFLFSLISGWGVGSQKIVQMCLSTKRLVCIFGEKSSFSCSLKNACIGIFFYDTNLL
jgi:hypothetical protein